MSKPTDHLDELRRKALFRLFERKFKASVRVTVGSATCENAAGAEEVYRTLKGLLEQHGGRGISVSRVGCAGKCDVEPVVTVISRGQIPVKYVKVTPEKMQLIFQSHCLEGKRLDSLTLRHQMGLPPARMVVSVCGARGCPAHNTAEVQAVLARALGAYGLTERISITEAACQGQCRQGPLVYVYPDGVAYPDVTPEKAERIVREHLKGRRPVTELVGDSTRITNRFFSIFGDVGFFGKQLRMTLRNCGVIDPESLGEYLSVRGYEAAARVLQDMAPEQVVQAVKLSGLRGRGGGGYPTGLKWEIGAAQKSERKFIICNADEGDPGAFMDRSTIEGDPHTILEGMIIGGYAIGADKGFVYIRAEYPLAVRRLEKAIADARKAGFLGRNIFGSPFSFDVEIRLGAGAFVCGEETALIHSIEGQRGMPRPRPPYPSVAGLWGHPTVINNVETFANIPVIILDGPEWFRSIGTEKSRGTKVFALAGDVANTGLVEVPMGTTLRQVVFDVGGGIKGGRKFKAVQTGGPAGGCLPETFLDTPVDYDSLAQAGSIMGSGGMIVMNEDACMVNVARYFLEFTQDESCGKCTPCREGTKRMLEILTRITGGAGQEGDVEKLLRLADTVKRSSLCGLGQAAPNPVISTIRHFRAEYDAHIREKRCPTGACKSLVTYTILAEACVGCGACRRKCPVNCIAGAPKSLHVIDHARCVKCGNCAAVCKFGAVSKS